MKIPCVYIMASRKNGTLYIGVTSNLTQRAWQHKASEAKGFTKEYKVVKLVYFEIFPDMNSAILREKQLKNWERKWKQDLIFKVNPEWRDLWPTIAEEGHDPESG